MNQPTLPDRHIGRSITLPASLWAQLKDAALIRHNGRVSRLIHEAVDLYLPILSPVAKPKKARRA